MYYILLIIAILCALLALSRNLVVYYYKKNDRLSELEVHFLFKYHKIYGGLGLLALIAYIFFVPFNIYIGCALGGYLLGATFAMIATKKYIPGILFAHIASMIFALAFMLFQLFI